MNISELSIKRPVLATVLNLVIIIFGAVGLSFLAVRDYPAIDPPMVSVSTSYTGANADIIESQITEPLEKQINGIPGIRTITSSSSLGSSQISVEFNLGVDLEAAASDVRDKVSQASRNLPQDINAPPVVPARLMQEIVSKFPAGRVELHTLAEGRMQLSCGSSKFELSTLPAEEFPNLPELDETSSAQLPQHALKSAIKQVAVAAASSQDESRAVMTGIHLTLEEGSLTMVATDGRRLACVRKSVEVPLIGEERLSVVVPARALIELSRLIESEGDVSLRVGKSQAFFKFDGYSLHCRLLEGRFPGWACRSAARSPAR